MERRAPKNAYFELLDQPDNKIPYTLNEDMVKRYNIPKFILAKTVPSENGITAQPTKLNTNVITGAKKKRVILAEVGKVVSLTNNFNPSANGCKSPK